MKKHTLFTKNDKPSRKTQEMQTVAIVVLAVAVVVLTCMVAVLLAQANDQRKSIDDLFNITTGLPTSEMLAE